MRKTERTTPAPESATPAPAGLDDQRPPHLVEPLELLADLAQELDRIKSRIDAAMLMIERSGR